MNQVRPKCLLSTAPCPVHGGLLPIAGLIRLLPGLTVKRGAEG